MANTKAIAYAEQIVTALNGMFRPINSWDFHFEVDKRGVKFIRVITADENNNGRSVHLFVDADGNVYKAAGWTGPAKGIRYNISTDEGMSEFLKRADRFGSYLYAR